MAINSVGSSSTYVSQVQPQPQTNVERNVEKVNNRDTEEVKKATQQQAAVQQEAPKPTVNTQGQTVGSLISVKA